jgi:hypothetical protein
MATSNDDTLEMVRIELAVIKEVLKRMEKSLWGGEGQAGVIDELKAKVATHDKWIWAATAVIATMQFLAGNGTVSLKSLLGK